MPRCENRWPWEPAACWFCRRLRRPSALCRVVLRGRGAGAALKRKCSVWSHRGSALAVWTQAGDRLLLWFDVLFLLMACQPEAGLQSCAVPICISAPAVTVSEALMLSPVYLRGCSQEEGQDAQSTRRCRPGSRTVVVQPWVESTAVVGARDSCGVGGQLGHHPFLLGQEAASMSLSKSESTAASRALQG